MYIYIYEKYYRIINAVLSSTETSSSTSQRSSSHEDGCDEDIASIEEDDDVLDVPPLASKQLPPL